MSSDGLAVPWTDPDLPEQPACPPQHGQRLALVTVQCTEHPCALCSVGPAGLGRLGGTTASGYCMRCELTAVDVVGAEGPPSDPWCLEHGKPTPDSRRGCTSCDIEVRAAKRRGWSFPGTDDVGPDCIHCFVCGDCQGAGRVCRQCGHCLDHPPPDDEPGCARSRWSSVRCRDVTYFEHEVWSPETGRWGV